MMKNILFFSMILLLASCGSAMTPEEKAAKAQKDAAEAELNQVQYNQAIAALDNKTFVLEAERVDFKRGGFQYVTSTTNFISVEGDKGTIQLALNGPAIGPNGIGGITVEGNVTDVKKTVDKKGNVSWSMHVMGVGVSATVFFRMTTGTNDCTATVTPDFNGNMISFTGSLYPTSESNVYKARAL